MTTLDFKFEFFARPSIARGNIKETGVPIYLRLTFRREKKVISSGISGPYLKWAKHLQRFNCDSHFGKKANKALDTMSRSLEDQYWRLVKGNDDVDFEKFISTVTGKHAPITLLGLFEKRLKEVELLEDKRYTRGTVKIYRNSFNHLRAYIEHKAKKDVPVKQLNHGFITDFYEYLLTKNVCTNTANKVLRKLKAVLNHAVENGIIDKNPFAGWKIRDDKVYRQALSVAELQKIYALEIHHPGVEKARDAFVFQCLTGLAHVDLKELNKSHIKREGDEVWIEKVRHKTHNVAIIPLFPMAVELINKYATHQGEGVFPVYTLQVMNRHLFAVGKLAGIEKPLTTHIGRHTFATVAQNNGVPKEFLETMMAVSSGKIVSVYAKITKPALTKAMKTVSDDLDF